MGSDVARRSRPVVGVAPGSLVPRAPVVPPLEPEPRAAPERPSLVERDPAPVLVKLPPPVVVRIAQLMWILSFAVGLSAAAYMLIIRTSQLPEIATLIKTVDDSRADGTYDTATDIVYWSVFAGVVVVVLAQIAMLVSFSNRKPNVRWFQFGSLFVQTVVLLVARELVAIGERGRPLELLLLIGIGLALLGMLFSILPPALRWSARKHDIRRGPA